MLSERHRQLVKQLAAQGWETRGFKAACRHRLAQRPWRKDGEDFLEVLDRFPYLPDAYRIAIGLPRHGWKYPVLVIDVMEVTVNHGVSEDKFWAYDELWFTVAGGTNVDFRFWEMDRDGVIHSRITSQDPVSLLNSVIAA